ncbi:LysR family transcriptional regulator [Sphingomonas flavalba]|uniref:LysR family transcriptional regulator n=1 Tax=Sphingomonas flavalba TaxID=2559804 RepID=UPI0039DF8D62
MKNQIHQVDLRLLRVFMAVVENNGFVNAQETLNIGQSTLSSHMADLEDRLGIRLCERGRAGFNVTEDGEMVYAAARKLFGHLDEFSSVIRSKKGKLSGTLNIACMDHIVSNHRLKLDEAIARFKDRRGDVSINIHVKSPLEVQQGVSEGAYDLGVSSPLKRTVGVEYIPLCTQRHQLYCGARHPLFPSVSDRMQVADLFGQEIVRPKYRQAEVLPKRLRRFQNMTATGFNIEGTAILIRSGRFIGFLPVNYADQWVRGGEMKAILPHQIEATVEIALVLKKGTPYKPQVRAFITDLLDLHGIRRDAGRAPAAPVRNAVSE